MSSIKVKAVPLSESDSEEDDLFCGKKKIKLEEQKTSGNITKRFTGGIVVSSEDENKDQSTSASMSAAEKKGLKEVEELERELDLKNTFSKETNRRDEDAEMNKFIEEQISKMRREEAKKLTQSSSQLDDKKTSEDDDLTFSLPDAETYKIDDILLQSLSKHLASSRDEKSEAMLSSQMLNGIPEIDLGINERIRTIEATEEAKLKLATSNSARQSNKLSSNIPVNFSSNFRQPRSRQDIHEDKSSKFSSSANRQSANSRESSKFVTEAVVVVGEEPNEIEYRLPSTGERPPPRGKASDDYYLSRFKKNNRK